MEPIFGRKVATQEQSTQVISPVARPTAPAMASTTLSALPVANPKLTLKNSGLISSPCHCSMRPQLWQGRRRRVVSKRLVRCQATEEDTRTPPTADASPLVKMAWYGSEAFGKMVAAFRPSSSTSEDEEAQEGDVLVGPVSRSEAAELIRKDYERSYFVTGNMNMGIYEADCEFADPFVSFKGLKRFKQNVSNLGSFMEESSLKITDWQEFEDRVYARWRFNCVLGLPWHPILAATGSTEYFFDENSGKIRKHVENWDISPADGVRQLFKPNPKKRK